MKKVFRAEKVLVDSGFWFALFNPRDSYHSDPNELLDLIRDVNIILPWPTLYETINTRLAKNINGINQFERILQLPNTILLDDIEYKNQALKYSLYNSTKLIRPISLVDSIIREVLSDVNLNINYLLTFNKRDFIDLCLKRRIDILYE